MVGEKTLSRSNMSIRILFRQTIYAVGFCCLSISSAIGQSLTVIDQLGNPVENAVVSIPSPADTVQPADQVVIMDQVDKRFLPRVVVVQKGQYVSFPNSDDIRHHVYSFSGIKRFEIKLYKGSDEPPILYDKAGVGVLGCNIHDGMVGFVYVAENEVAKVTNTSGQVTFSQDLPETVHVWHEDMSFEQTARTSVPIVREGNALKVYVNLVRRAQTKKRSFGSRKFGSKG